MNDPRQLDEQEATDAPEAFDAPPADDSPDSDATIEASQIESEGDGRQEMLLSEILASVQRHEVATAQWFEVVRGDLGVLYEQLDLLVKSVLGETPSEHPATSSEPPSPPEAPLPEPAAAEPPPATLPPAEPAPVSEPEPHRQETGGFASRLMAAAAGPSDDGSAWESVIFGDELAANPSIAEGRKQIIAGLQQQEPAAMALAGTLLEVRSAANDRVPQLLKDVGEAYYQWHPAHGSESDALRDCLIVWLEGKCDEIGAGNRIELARVGDRYDSTRHNAKSRGVEVADVYGWIVLRDNGKVYTKASVAVR